MSHNRRSVPTLPVVLLRDAVARESARVSLRRAASAIGVSPNGLRNFLNGAAPRNPTRTKLERWLSAQQPVARPPNVGQLVRLLNELSADLSPQQTMLLGRDVAELLYDAYEARSLTAPRWVHSLLQHFGRDGKRSHHK